MKIGSEAYCNSCKRPFIVRDIVNDGLLEIDSERTEYLHPISECHKECVK